jgi:hypothetical protein
MEYDSAVARCRRLYARLLRLYPKPFRERFGEGMAQTFGDLCRERKEAGSGLFAFASRTFVETFAGMVRERIAALSGNEKTIGRPGLAAVSILLLPLLAMQFTDQVDWDLTDFAVAGVLLFGAGLTYALVARKAASRPNRVAVGLAVATALMLVWINLAVGLIGSEENPANLMYVGVLAVAVVGATIARFRPHGMTRALFTTALAQVLVAVIAVIRGLGSTGPIWPWDILVLNGFFAALWVGSALLFRRARDLAPYGRS